VVVGRGGGQVAGHRNGHAAGRRADGRVAGGAGGRGAGRRRGGGQSLVTLPRIMQICVGEKRAENWSNQVRSNIINQVVGQ